MAAQIAIGIVVALHLYFMVLEMFLWDKPFGRRTFGHSAEQAKLTKTLAANQGLYNGFLAAGLIWGLYLGNRGDAVSTFFLVCIVIAGLFGAATANRKILFFQALPALVAIALLWFG